MAEEDLNALNDLRCFSFRSANTACYLSQQYAEKMIKAKLLLMGESVQYTHNLIHLLDYFDDTPDIEVAREYGAILTSYESRARYPRGKVRIFTPEEAENAYEMALEIPYLIGLYNRPE